MTRKTRKRVVLAKGYLITWAGAYACRTGQMLISGNVWKADERFAGKVVRLVAEVIA